ncbi:thiamine ABC transporter substrate binding subunit [[Pasteurella] aerogenes]
MFKKIVKKTGLFSTALLLASGAFSVAANVQPVAPLNVYTYDSFSADWGAGPKVKALFEKAQQQCQIHYVPFDSSGTLFNRLRLEGKKTKADVVLGLDHYVLDEARKTGLFVPNKVDLTRLSLPISWQDSTFLPYDFGQYAFIYDKTKLTNPPQTLQELIEREDLRVIYQDPRTSAVGRGLVVWMNAVFNADNPSSMSIEAAWQQLAKHTVTVGKGWSESYGAFLKGESDLVLSYNTSPLYHLLQEQKDQYAAANLQEGGVLQIEVAAKTVVSQNPCADLFLDFLLTPQAQSEIAKYNVMLPVIDTPIEPSIDALRAQQMQAKVFDTTNIQPTLLKQWISQWQVSLTK